jgi:hypothetical protein
VGVLLFLLFTAPFSQLVGPIQVVLWRRGTLYLMGTVLEVIIFTVGLDKHAVMNKKEIIKLEKERM